MRNSTFFNFGKALALSSRCQDVDTVKSAEAFSEALDNSVEFQTIICKCAAAIYSAGGRDGALGQALFDKMAIELESTSQPLPAELTVYTDAVLETLASNQEKTAASLKALTMIPKNVLAGALKGVPDALKSVLAISGITGASAGTLAFLLNRHGGTDNTEVESTRQQALQYEQLSRELDEKLKKKTQNESLAGAL